MKLLSRLFLLLSSFVLGISAHAQTGGTEAVMVQKTPAKATGYVPVVQSNGTIQWKPQSGGGGGGGTWGSILGDLTAQTDLQIALDAKLAITTAASTYQPVNAKLTGFAALANASGYLFNNGSGVFSYQTPPGAGDALTTNPLSQFASTSSAQLRAVLNDETGTGIAYFVGGAAGTPASITLTNGSGLPISGITGLGTGLPAAFAINVGTAGSPVLNGGAGGTPSSIVLTNASGTAASLTAGSVTTNANSTGAITSVGNATSLGSFTFSAFNSATTGDDAAGLAANNAFTGINQQAGASVTNANAMGALAIDVTKSINTKTVAANSTFTFSGTPATANTWFALRVTNSDSSDRVMTIPSSFNANTQSTATTFVVLAGGTETITWCYDGSTYVAYGIPSADYAADAGANDTYTITLNPVLTAYSTGARFWFKANTANTGAATLNINALGAKTIMKVAGGITTTLADNDIRAGQLVGLIYDGTNFQMTTPLGNAPAGSGDALVANPLSQFASTTSAQLRGVLSDESGTGIFVTQGGDMGAGTATTASANDNDTSIATTAYVQAELTAHASDTVTLTNKTIDAAATGNVLKLKGYVYLTHPHLADGTNATIGTTATALDYGHATFSNSVDQASNYVEYYLQVPEDIDTSVALRARIKVRLGGADTASQRYVLSSVSVADSAVPTSSTLANAINIDFAGDASGASGDVETSAWTTLTSWNGALTAGQTWRIRFARDGDTSDASTTNSTELGLVIEYGITQ